MSGSKKESHWIPLADLMTVLMVIFLFMSISYMASIQNKIKGKEKAVVDLLATLDSTFKNDFKKWNIVLDSDLSIKFINPEVLFDQGDAIVKDSFKNILKNFLPKYLNVVMQEKYKDVISEIRIEGHTNNKPINKTNDPYIDNMELSQNRARNVLLFLRQQQCYLQLDSIEKNRIQYWFTANGLSYGRMVDNNFNLIYGTNNIHDPDKSRRVEFRIVTDDKKIINDLTKNN